MTLADRHAGAGSEIKSTPFRRLVVGAISGISRHRLVSFPRARRSSQSTVCARHGPLNDRADHRANTERRGISNYQEVGAQDRELSCSEEFRPAFTALPVCHAASIEVCRAGNLRGQMHRSASICLVQAGQRCLQVTCSSAFEPLDIFPAS